MCPKPYYLLTAIVTATVTATVRPLYGHSSQCAENVSSIAGTPCQPRPCAAQIIHDAPASAYILFHVSAVAARASAAVAQASRSTVH